MLLDAILIGDRPWALIIVSTLLESTLNLTTCSSQGILQLRLFNTRKKYKTN
jgi:hypothetical protein